MIQLDRVCVRARLPCRKHCSCPNTRTGQQSEHQESYRQVCVCARAYVCVNGFVYTCACMPVCVCVCSRCAVVCVQQLQRGFPWWRFSVVLEFQCVGDSAVRSICIKKKLHYTCFTTAAPCTGVLHFITTTQLSRIS